MIGMILWTIGALVVFLGMWILPLFLKPEGPVKYFQWAIAIGVVGSVCLMAFRWAVLPQLATAWASR